MALAYGVYGVCGYGAMACVGTVYGVQALGVRVYGVRCVYVSCGVCVRCTCVCRYIDVVSVRRIRPIETKHLKQSFNDIKRNTTNTKRMNAYSIVFK